MNWDVVGAISAFVASVATLLTLIYLAIQVRESNKLAKDSSLQSVLDGYTDRAVQTAVESPEKLQIFWMGQLDYINLSFIDKVVFDGMITRDILHLRNVIQHHENGLIDDDEYETWLIYVVAEIKTPGGHDCWEQLKVSHRPIIAATIDRFMKNNPSTPSLIDLYPQKVNEIKKILSGEIEQKTTTPYAG